MENYYSLLEISDSATADEIKSAYRKLAVKYHPDKNPNNPGAEEKFKIINTAYQTLSDPNKKWRYDQLFFREEEPEQTTYYNHYSAENHTSYQKKNRSKPPPAYRTTKKRSYYESGSEWKGWLWSLGVIFIGILLIGAPMGIFEYVAYQEKKEKEKLSAELLEKTDYYKYHKKYRLAFEYLKKLSIVDTHFKDYDYRKRLLFNLKHDIKTAFKNKNYDKTIELIGILKDYDELKSKDELLYFTLAESYAAIGLIGEANDIISFLEKEDNSYITNWNLINTKARILMHDGNLAKAKAIYHQAVKDIISGYSRDYGSAYFMTMNPRNQPEDHYTIFYGKLLIDIQSKDYQSALKNLEWTINMRPGKPLIYYQKGVIMYALGKYDEGCKLWKKAFKLGLRDKIELANIKKKGCL